MVIWMIPVALRVDWGIGKMRTRSTVNQGQNTCTVVLDEVQVATLSGFVKGEVVPSFVSRKPASLTTNLDIVIQIQHFRHQQQEDCRSIPTFGILQRSRSFRRSN